jgi:hypothetical protein
MAHPRQTDQNFPARHPNRMSGGLGEQPPETAACDLIVTDRSMDSRNCLITLPSSRAAITDSRSRRRLLPRASMTMIVIWGRQGGMLEIETARQGALLPAATPSIRPPVLPAMADFLRVATWPNRRSCRPDRGGHAAKRRVQERLAAPAAWPPTCTKPGRWSGWPVHGACTSCAGSRAARA